MSQASGSSGPVNGGRGEISALGGFWRWLCKLFRRGNGDSQLRDTIEEIIGEIEEAVPEQETATPMIASLSKTFLTVATSSG